MSGNWRRWGSIAVAALLACGALAGLAGASEEVLFGPKEYVRSGGWVSQYRETIELPSTLTAPFRLQLETGDRHGSERVLLAEVRLNGHRVAGLLDFLWEGASFDHRVPLQARNTLQVSLASRPGSWIRLTLYGTVPPPTLTSLEPTSLSITQGGTGTLTATLRKRPDVPTLLHLQSSAPDIASVPDAVPVPAGECKVPIPVAGLSPGTAVITASLHGSQLASTVTVVPVGPTITSLLPATLQLTQGAAGRLTITLSAAQANDTLVSLSTSDSRVLGLPSGGSVSVPAGQTSQTFEVFGNSPGTATLTATLNGSEKRSEITVLRPLPAIVSLLPSILPLTEGSRGTLTVTLNASQPTDTDVQLSTEPPGIVGLPGDRVTVPAGDLSADFPVTGLARGMASVKATLNDSDATAAIRVSPPLPTVETLTCPGQLTLAATGLCRVSLNATQLTDTVVPLDVSDRGVLTSPDSVTVPAGAVAVAVPIVGVSPGSATLTAGPLNGKGQTATVQVLSPPPSLVSLVPASPAVMVGATVSLTLTLTAVAFEDTPVPLDYPHDLLAGPDQVTVPAGALAVAFPLKGLKPGTATVIAGPLNGSTVQTSLTVNQLPPTLSGLTPGTLSLPKGKPGTLTVTITPTQPQETVVELQSGAPTTVGVQERVTVPAGAESATFPVLSLQVGDATITAGPLNGTTQSATVTVTPAELLTLTVSPAGVAIPLGKTEPFTATGSYTDGSTRDLTATATWSSSDESVATVNGGIATGHQEGETTITAEVGTINGTATLTITPPVLVRLTVAPEYPGLRPGDTVQFTATGTRTDGSTQDLTTAVTWTSSNLDVASISPLGLATALTLGSSTITASHPAGFAASTLLTVSLTPPSITGFSPTSGPVGTAVTIRGSNFQSVLAVTFNGVAATNIGVAGPTTLFALVPAGATTGRIRVQTPAGTAISATDFVVTQNTSLVVEPSMVTALAGTSASLKVSTLATGEFTGPTRLSLGPLPPGLTAAFGTPALGPTTAGLLALMPSASTPSPATLEIRGTSGVSGTPLTPTASATLVVQASGPTVLAGQVRDGEDQPLAGMSLRCGQGTIINL